MKNYVQEGDVLTVNAPYAVISGAGVLVGALFGIATRDAANGAAVDIMPEGVFDLTANGADVGAAGTKVYWDNANKRITTTAAGNTLVGVLVLDKANGDSSARVYLDGVIR
jgi:predicted RecA/RadA family phage recombinase